MDFVLVHGTTQSPAGWDRLVAALTRRGHRGVTVDLWTDEPLVGVGDYAQLAAAQVSACNGPVVVVHSGSGALLPIIAEALDATAMVWLAAYIPDFTNRRSLFDEIQAYPTRLFHADWLGVDPTADTSAACRFLFHNCDPNLQQWARPTCEHSPRPPPTGTRPALNRRRSPPPTLPRPPTAPCARTGCCKPPPTD